MTIEHLVITPFCIRNPTALRQGGGWQPDLDPLKPDFLDQRLNLLEILASPAMRGQTPPPTTWVIIVDPELSEDHRRQLERVVGDDIRMKIHTYDATVDYASSEWLEPYMKGHPDFLITTQLDDDDALPRNYIQQLQQAAQRFIQSTDMPIMRIFGTTKIWMWHLVHTWRTPLGMRSQWAGSANFTNCGLSLLCKYPEVPLNALALRHIRAENYLDFSAEPADTGVAQFRSKLRDITSNLGTSVDQHASSLGLGDLSSQTGPVLLANHGGNLQRHRIFKARLQPTIVRGPETFPQHDLDWEVANRYIPQIKLSITDKLHIRWLRLRAMARVVVNSLS